MSDDEDFMADDDNYDFEYESESASEPDVDLENQYYNSKQMEEDHDEAGALEGFSLVVELETEKGEWGFKALKHMVQIYFNRGNYEAMMKSYRKLLTYIKSAVSRNYSETSINTILDTISTSQQMELLQEVYETTLEALNDAKNDRLLFKTKQKLGKTYLDREEYVKLGRVVKELKASCLNEDGSEDVKKGTSLLEIYSLEIQMHTAQKNTKKLKELYEKSLRIKSAIPHPFTMGIIRECGGKMHLIEENFEKSYEDFFEAFKNYDEAGSGKKISCLKYLVLACMLMKSKFNPFDAQESKPYKNDPQILAMTNLVNAYQAHNIREFESVLRTNRQSIMDDPFIRDYVQDLLKNIRTEVMIKIIEPYTQVKIPYIASELNISPPEVETLLVASILDGTIAGRIDQVGGLLVLDRHNQKATKFSSLEKWTSQLDSLSANVLGKMP